MQKILLAEDDRELNQSLCYALKREGYSVVSAFSVKEARMLYQTECPHLILLDVNLPDGEGYEFCRWVKEKTDIPVLFLTARDLEEDVLRGYELGAWDYVAKPFELEGLYSRIQALLRRTGNVAEQYLSCGGIEIDQNRHTVSCHAEEISLSEAEYRLLLYLMQNKGKTVTREKILEQVWDVNGNYVNNNTLTVTMKRLRDKLYQPECMKTVRSIGYRMEDTI